MAVTHADGSRFQRLGQQRYANLHMGLAPGAWDGSFVDPIRFLRGELTVRGIQSDLRDAYEKAEQPIGKTFNGFKGLTEGEPIDYIFVSPDVEVTDIRVDRSKIADGFPSDHYPVAAEVIF